MNKSVLIALLGLSSVEGVKMNQNDARSTLATDSGAAAAASGNASNATAAAQNDSANATATAAAAQSAPVMDFVKALVEVDQKQDDLDHEEEMAQVDKQCEDEANKKA